MNTNNIGGVIQADFLFTDEISLFSVINHSAVISLHRPNTWRNLPITYMGVSPDVEADDTQAGTLYKQTLTIRLKRTWLRSKMQGCEWQYPIIWKQRVPASGNRDRENRNQSLRPLRN